MTRITCEVPSNEEEIAHIANLGTSFATLVEAPDFSVPTTGDDFLTPDSAVDGNVLREGVAYIPARAFVYNKNAAARTLDVQILREGGGAVALFSVVVQGGATLELPLGGVSLFKRDFSGSNGDRLQVRASATNSLDVTAWYQTRIASDHLGVS